MIQKSRFNAILLCISLFGGMVAAPFGEGMWGIPAVLCLFAWFFVMLASFIKLAATGQPILYTTKVTRTEEGFTEHS